MELDELKKLWNVLDAQLQKEPIADEGQIKELIASHKANADKSLRRISGLQRFSIGIGAVGLIVIVLTWLLVLPSFAIEPHIWNKIAAFLVFIGISIIAGMWWDWKTYRWNKETLIDEMPVAQVSRRMNTFRRWTRNEVIAISVWVILFNLLNYWVMGYHQAPALTQVVLTTVFLIFDALIIYLLYKKLIYRHLDSIKKNIEELEDICTE
ncbi:MAG: hypothetical protein LUE99_16395 [Bacteroides sp.]|nr:hypothetical protein [Bacteroides sp.]